MKPTALDALLFERARAQEPAAFQQLFELYKTPVYNFVVRMIGRREDAEDVVQEVFVKLYHKLGTLREPKYFTTWLFSIAKNEAINYARKHRRKEMLALEPVESETRAPFTDNAASNVEQILIEEEMDDLLQNALAAVPEVNRAAFILGVLEEYSYKEVADMLGCTENNVKSRVFRARAVISARLKSYLNPA
ncbi:sigma-70 family RNA polymerase sigma factor [candidate division KSB1 bacterium]|nr:sigma-70 family RNA polymerase sigma factor [candidate division KSB1 bacterium]